MGTYFNLILQQGTTFLASFYITDANNNPVDLTSLTIESQMKHYYDSNVAITFTCNGYSNGYLTLSSIPSITSNVAPNNYVYDVVFRDSSNNLVRPIEGVIKVTPEATIFS